MVKIIGYWTMSVVWDILWILLMYRQYISGVDSSSVYILLTLFVITRIICCNCDPIIVVDRERGLKLYLRINSKECLIPFTSETCVTLCSVWARNDHVRCEAPTGVYLTVTVFWEMASCNLLEHDTSFSLKVQNKSQRN